MQDQNDAADIEAIGSPAASAVAMVSSFARRYFGSEIREPTDLATAARYLMQIDRSLRAANFVAKAEASKAGPGPFGGGRSKHVLYLRSFIASPRLPRIQVEPWGQVDLEELLACMLDRSPLIALGDTDLERFGPGRAKSNDENWREVLRALAVEAQMLLVIPAPTAGTSWEIEWVDTNKFLHKTCFVMPPPGAGQESWWADNWRQLREWSVRLGVVLPEYTPAGCIFRLTSEGLIDRLDLSEIYGSGNLHLMLLTHLLLRPNISPDFQYVLRVLLKPNELPVAMRIRLERRIQKSRCERWRLECWLSSRKSEAPLTTANSWFSVAADKNTLSWLDVSKLFDFNVVGLHNT
jgi:hypothetical protein